MAPMSAFFHDYLYNFVYVVIFIFSVSWYIWVFFTKSKTLGTSQQLPPGPRGLPVVGSLPFLDPDLHTYLYSLARKYGPIFRLRLGSKLAIVLTSPSLARETLKDQDINFANRDAPLTGRAISYGGIDIVWSSYGAEWRMLRKICTVKLLSRQVLGSFYHLRRHEIRTRTRYLYEKGQERVPVDVGDQMFMTLLNLTMNMLWGGTVLKRDELSTDIEIKFKKAIQEVLRLVSESNLSDLFPWLAPFDLQGHVRGMQVQARELDHIFDQVIKKCGETGYEECKDFLQYLLKLKEEGDSDIPITLNHIKALLMDMVIGGTDTSSNTISFAMAELIRKPEIMKRAQEEVDEAVGKDSIVEESHVTKLPYLDAIVKETLRLHPTLPLLVPHSPSETTIVGGYVVPKGSKVFVNVWAIHRDPEVWKDPLEFRPERFFNKPCDFTGNDHSFIPFGTGRRICPGVALAEKVVMYTMATLLHSFDWQIPEGSKYDIEEKFGITLKLKNPLVAIPVPRLSDPTLY